MKTVRQKKAFQITKEAAQKDEVLSIGEIMRRAGYSLETSKHPEILIKSKGWTELLAEIQDEPLMTRLVEIALDKEDKRACIEAIKEVMKLKDKYPAGKLKVQAFNEELDRIQEDS